VLPMFHLAMNSRAFLESLPSPSVIA